MLAGCGMAEVVSSVHSNSDRTWINSHSELRRAQRVEFPVGVEQGRLGELNRQPRCGPTLNLRLADMCTQPGPNEELQSPPRGSVLDRNQVDLPVGDRGPGRNAKAAAKPRPVRGDNRAERKDRACRLILELDGRLEAGIRLLEPMAYGR